MSDKHSIDFELTSYSGIALHSIVNPELLERQESYPLRQRLVTVSRFCWHSLLIEHHSRGAVIAACHALESEWHKFLADCTDLELQENPIARSGMSERSPLAVWSEEADLDSTISILEESWLSSLCSSGQQHIWRWHNIYSVAALVAVDHSIKFLENDEPYKAGTWCSLAHEYRGTSLALCLSECAPSELGKRAADIRHATNRKATAQAIQLFKAQSWLSIKKAAREIAPQVHRTEEVVERWIRAHKKRTSPVE